MNKNAFTELVDNLKNGSITANQIQIAYRSWVRQNEKIPADIKNLLCGKKHSGGMIFEVFNLIAQFVGNMELAYRRGYHAGYEDGCNAKLEK